MCYSLERQDRGYATGERISADQLMKRKWKRTHRLISVSQLECTCTNKRVSFFLKMRNVFLPILWPYRRDSPAAVKRSRCGWYIAINIILHFLLTFGTLNLPWYVLMFLIYIYAIYNENKYINGVLRIVLKPYNSMCVF